jgi:hypothetical protein
MNIRSNIVALALAGAGLLGLSSLNASAAIVCNEDGDCWHTPEAYTYPPGAHIVIHPNEWRWGPGEHFAWKEHQGRGYWEGGNWITIRP